MMIIKGMIKDQLTAVRRSPRSHGQYIANNVLTPAGNTVSYRNTDRLLNNYHGSLIGLHCYEKFYR